MDVHAEVPKWGLKARARNDASIYFLHNNKVRRKPIDDMFRDVAQSYNLDPMPRFMKCYTAQPDRCETGYRISPDSKEHTHRNALLVTTGAAYCMTSWHDMRWGYCAYFGFAMGPNVCECLGRGTKFPFHHYQDADPSLDSMDIHAAIRALDEVEHLKRTPLGEPLQDIFLHSASAFVVHAMTIEIFRWRKKDFKDTQGRNIRYASLFKLLDDRVAQLRNLGVHVLFWHTVEYKGSLAKQMAIRACEGEIEGDWAEHESQTVARNGST